MSSKGFPPPNFRSPKSLRLGCLIVNPEDTYQETHDPLQDRPATAEIDIEEYGGFHETRASTKTSRFRTFLSDILSFSHERRNKSTSTLEAPQFTTHKLKNQNTWFHDACGTSKTRAWLEKALNDRRDIYLLVGFFILRDAKLTKSDSSTKKGTSGIEVPIVPAGLAILDTTISLATGARYTQDTSYGIVSILDIPGEQMFGIWYRKVRFKWSFSREVGVPSLDEKTRWRPLWVWRGVQDEGDDEEDEEEEEEDIIEATLEDEGHMEEGNDSGGEGSQQELRSLVSVALLDVPENQHCAEVKSPTLDLISTSGNQNPCNTISGGLSTNQLK